MTLFSRCQVPEVMVGTTAARWGDVVCVKPNDVDAVDVQQVYTHCLAAVQWLVGSESDE
jgi:hypothetical protein